MTKFSRAFWPAVLLCAAASLVAGPEASAADESASTSVDIAFLGEVMVLILVGRILAEIMQRLGQPAVMGPLIGRLLLLLAGMETELRLLHRIGYAALAVSIAGISLPFAFGFSLGEVLPTAV